MTWREILRGRLAGRVCSFVPGGAKSKLFGLGAAVCVFPSLSLPKLFASLRRAAGVRTRANMSKTHQQFPHYAQLV
jgi:hypothetical protein